MVSIQLEIDTMRLKMTKQDSQKVDELIETGDNCDYIGVVGVTEDEIYALREKGTSGLKNFATVPKCADTVNNFVYVPKDEEHATQSASSDAELSERTAYVMLNIGALKVDFMESEGYVNPQRIREYIVDPTRMEKGQVESICETLGITEDVLETTVEQSETMTTKGCLVFLDKKVEDDYRVTEDPMGRRVNGVCFGLPLDYIVGIKEL